ncbi:toll/interleukin-1 receptor domain-containing protein [Tenacibaculum amylolyticum]|uniref:toll/interleukin-1 receptor domain-containing protein n=1 Tax=Tenacibaculum amylolyticum TaxID=104269 RepID=UPI003894843B
MNTNKPEIFVSHISSEKKYAISIKEWIDETLLGAIDIFVSSDKGESIPLGSEWLKKTKKSLQNSSIILVIISNRSLNTKWLYFESGAGYVRDIPVIPICIGELKKNELPPPLNSLEGIEFPNKDDEKKLIEIIAESAGLKSPKKIYSSLVLPKGKISKLNKEEILNPKININNFKDNFNQSKALIKIVSFFNTKRKQTKFTITQIEKTINTKNERNRRFIVIILNNLLTQELLEKVRIEGKTYWMLTEKGKLYFQKIQ